MRLSIDDTDSTSGNELEQLEMKQTIRMKKSFLVVMSLVMLCSAKAQENNGKWGIGINAGSQQYNGDLGNGFYRFDQAFYGFGGITINRNLTDHFDVEINGTMGEIGHVENDNNSFRHMLFQFNVNARYNFLNTESKLRPFVFAGLGYMRFNDKRSNSTYDNMALPDFGAGLNYRVTPLISIVLKETFIYSDFDNVDGESTRLNDFYLQHSLGVMFHLGKVKDTDGDGIADRKDDCPEESGIAAFNGCADTDGDGIPDSKDNCPQVKGDIAFNGCPDTDGDGIVDQEDECPNIKGLKEFSGCADSDNDGVPDNKDKCPNTKGLIDFGGCPDTDGDGVEDSKDSCPSVAGLVGLNGCPDTDKDGIADGDDTCPTVAGVKANNGCPEVKEEEKEILAEAVHGIKFRSGKDIITASSYGILDNVVKVLKQNSSYKLQIDGHTDSMGDDQMNLNLSKNRAKAVKAYLVDKGIEASRLSSEGYGESKPVADNANAAGRAENRRVELTIQF